MSLRLLLGALLLVGLGSAGSADGPVAWLDCSFGPLPGRESARLLVMTVGRRAERAVIEGLGVAPVDPSGLTVGDDGRIAGTLIVGHEPLRMNRTLVPRISSRMALRLDLAIRGSVVTGTFSGSWPKAKSNDQPEKVEGKVAGVVRDEPRLREEFGLNPEAAWPGWLGPNQNFSAGPSAVPLLDDLSQARLVWASQWIGPTESGSQRYGACVGSSPCAGGASPIVWKGRVYQFRYQASGDAFQEAHLEKILGGDKGAEVRARMAEIGWTEADLRRRWAIDADEELISIDGATGRTLWTVRWPGEGINLYDHKCSLTNHTGVAAGDRIFVFGALGIVRAVDAASGKILWATEVPGYADFMRKFKADALQKKNVGAPTRSFCHALNVSGGTVLAPDGIGACGVVGLDSTTGKVLWRVEKVLGKAATPMAWRKDGKDYVVAADAQGVIAFIEAATGRVVWRYAEAGDNEYQTLLVGDLLVGHKLKAAEREKAPRSEDSGPRGAPGSNYGQVACWRLSLTGPEPLWTAPAEWGAPSSCPIGSAAGGLVCFRGNYSYHLVEPESGRRVASRPLPVAVRWDEGTMLALPGLFVLHPDSQHGQTKMFPLRAKPEASVGSLWCPPHPHATTYQSAMSHAWADGRLFIRGADAIYCYDLRKKP